jgi:hypothetical protein
LKILLVVSVANYSLQREHMSSTLEQQWILARCRREFWQVNGHQGAAGA